MAGGKSGGGIIAMAMRHSQIVIFVVCCLCAFGIYGLSEMRKNEFPEFTVRQGVVVAVCPGYTAAEMEERVVKPLENYIFEYKEVKKTRTKSMCRDGIAYIQVQLNDNLKDKDEFWSKFKHGVNDFKTQLPQSVLALKVLDDFGDTSAMPVALESDQKTYNELSDYIDVLEAKLRRIVGRMTVYRMQQEQISIKIDHARLSQYALTEKALLSKLYTQGFVTSGGHIKNDGYESPIHITPTANNEYEIAETVIFTDPAGNSLRLKDVAEIVREYPEPTSFIRNNGRKCLLLSVEMKPGFNMVQIGKNVNNEITDFEKSLPDNVYVYRITDQSKVVGDSVNNFLPKISLSGTGMAANEHLIQLPLQFPPELPIHPQNIQMVKNGLTANVTAMLPVYAGVQIYYGNRLAKVGTEVEQLKLKQSENEVRMAVTQYYWQIILLKEKVKTVEAINLQLASIYEDAEAAYQAGVSTRNDVLQVDLKKNEMESASLELNNNIEILKMLLAQFIGITEATSFDVGSGSLSDGVEDTQSVMITPEVALSSTSEYQLLDRQIEAAEVQKKITRGEFLPKVAVGGGYFYNNLLDRSQNSLIGMVTVSIPISWKSGFSMKRMKLAVENAMMEMSYGSERLVIGMRKAYSDLDVAYRNIRIATKSIEQAKENLRMHEDFYQVGTATMSDLLDAQTLYQQSCDHLSEAVATYEIKRVEYLVMTGR